VGANPTCPCASSASSEFGGVRVITRETDHNREKFAWHAHNHNMTRNLRSPRDSRTEVHRKTPSVTGCMAIGRAPSGTEEVNGGKGSPRDGSRIWPSSGSESRYINTRRREKSVAMRQGGLKSMPGHQNPRGGGDADLCLRSRALAFGCLSLTSRIYAALGRSELDMPP
jgi:hypothetical protein